MLIYTYRIIEKHGFKYIDTSQYSYDIVYFMLGDIELEYNRLMHSMIFKNTISKKIETHYFYEDSTDDELDNIIRKLLRRYKLTKLNTYG